MITDAQIDAAFDGTNFGTRIKSNRRRHLALWALKIGIGWYCGHTAAAIMLDLGLVSDSLSGGRRQITDKGGLFCFDFFSGDTASPEPQTAELLEVRHAATEALQCVVDSGVRLDQRIMDRITAALEKAGGAA